MSPPTHNVGFRRRKPLLEYESSSDDEEFATPAPAGRSGKKGTTPRQETQAVSGTATPSTQTTSQSQRGRKTPGGAGASQLGTQARQDMDIMNVEDLTNTVVKYFLILHTKKVPFKKAEIVKNAMNLQSKDFAEVIVEAGQVLEDVFGCRLVAMKADDKGNVKVVPISEGNTFMVVNLFDTAVLKYSGIQAVDSRQNDGKKGILRIILNCIYMLNRQIDEDYIWQIITTMGEQADICPRREDLRKFLKTECVDPMYLSRQEIKGVDGSMFRYTWGIRADMELDKYNVLKHVGQTMNKNPESFKNHYFELLQNEDYRVKIAEEKERGLSEETQYHSIGIDDTVNEELEEIGVTQQNQKKSKTATVVSSSSSSSSLTDADEGDSDSSKQTDSD